MLSHDTLNFDTATWIWTSEQVSLRTAVGSRPFRKTFTTTPDKRALTANILITADNNFELFVNGRPVGSGTDQWQNASRFDDVPLDSGPTNLVAVNATNDFNPRDPTGAGNAAGLLVTIQVNYADGSSSLVTSDASWRTLPSAPFVGFEKTSVDDSTTWAAASTFGAYGPETPPWSNSVSIPPSPNSPSKPSDEASSIAPTSATIGTSPFSPGFGTSPTDTTSSSFSQPSLAPSATSAPNKATTVASGISFIWVICALVATYVHL